MGEEGREAEAHGRTRRNGGIEGKIRMGGTEIRRREGMRCRNFQVGRGGEEEEDFVLCPNHG